MGGAGEGGGEDEIWMLLGGGGRNAKEVLLCSRTWKEGKRRRGGRRASPIPPPPPRRRQERTPRFIKTKGACSLSLSLYLSVVFALERNGGRKEESRKRLKFGVFAAKTRWLSEQKKGFFFTREALVSWSDLFHAQQRPQEEEDTVRAKMGRIRDIVKGGPLLNELRIATVQLACDMCQRQIPLVFLKKKKERKNNLSPSRSMIHLTSAQEEKCEKKQIRDK